MARESHHANSTNFTIMHQNRIYNYEMETYSMNNYFEVINLQPDTYTTGWLLFLLPKAEKYTLIY